MRPLYLLGVIPVLGLVVGVFFVNQVEPFVFGMPFLMFWIVLWVVLTTVVMWIIYRYDPRNHGGDVE